MEFYTKDRLLIDIYNIRNIESIKLDDFVSKNSSENSKLVVVPLLTVFCDGNKVLSLSSKEKYFNTFVKKVVQVYNDEKNNILEDSLTDPFGLNSNIKIDDYTKKILESGLLENSNELYKFYENKECYEYSLLFQKDEVKLLLPIVKYHIKKLFSNTDKEVTFDDEFIGYRNYYLTSGKIDGVYTEIPFLYNKLNDNEYLFEVGNLLDRCSSLKININFNKDRIVVRCSLLEYKIVNTFTYLITDGVVKSINDAIKNDITVKYENIDLSECNNNLLNIVNFDRESKFKWFMLPWNAYYGINTNVTNLSEIEKNIEISSMYLYSLDKSFMRKEYFSKNYKRNDTISVSGENIVLDSMKKNTLGINLLSDIYFIETSFLDSLYSNGYYDEKLKNKYFYHLVRSDNGISGIDRENLISIGKLDEVLDNGDILNDELVLKLVRGKNNGIF